MNGQLESPISAGRMAATDQEALRLWDAAVRELYGAECALHDAHQSHVDQWINAANEHLHRAIAHYLAVQAELRDRHIDIAA